MHWHLNSTMLDAPLCRQRPSASGATPPTLLKLTRPTNRLDGRVTTHWREFDRPVRAAKVAAVPRRVERAADRRPLRLGREEKRSAMRANVSLLATATKAAAYVAAAKRAGVEGRHY